VQRWHAGAVTARNGSVMGNQPKRRMPLWLLVLIALAVLLVGCQVFVEAACNDDQGFSCAG
jgi:hypothetical protein